MHITVDNLRSMAKPKRISNSSGAGGPKNSINEYERQRQRTIEKNKRKLTELGIQRTLRSMRRTNETIQRQSQENSDEDDEYNSMEYERLHEEFKAVPSDTPRSSVRKTSFEGHVTKTSSGERVHVEFNDDVRANEGSSLLVPISEGQVPRTRSSLSLRGNDSSYFHDRGNPG